MRSIASPTATSALAFVNMKLRQKPPDREPDHRVVHFRVRGRDVRPGENFGHGR